MQVLILCVTDSGRVRVFVRVRPPRPQENSRKELIAVNVEELSSKVSGNITYFSFSDEGLKFLSLSKLLNELQAHVTFE